VQDDNELVTNVRSQKSTRMSNIKSSFYRLAALSQKPPKKDTTLEYFKALVAEADRWEAGVYRQRGKWLNYP
jgi:hypothetical protein